MYLSEKYPNIIFSPCYLVLWENSTGSHSGEANIDNQTHADKMADFHLTQINMSKA